MTRIILRTAYTHVRVSVVVLDERNALKYVLDHRDLRSAMRGRGGYDRRLSCPSLSPDLPRLSLRAAETIGCRVHGITLSKEQKALAEEKVLSMLHDCVKQQSIWL